MAAISVITPTGDRHTSLSLCRFYVRRQSIPVQWVVVDDGQEPWNPGADVYVRRERRDDDPAHTITVQIPEALAAATGDLVVVMEDDDWYGPHFVERIASYLQKAEVAGEGIRRIWRADIKWGDERIKRGRKHTALASMGWRRTHDARATAMCIEHRDDPFVDRHIWEAASSSFMGWEEPQNMAIKGLPGRPGTKEHQKLWGRHDETLLHKWIGDDALRYNLRVWLHKALFNKSGDAESIPDPSRTEAPAG